MTKILPYTSKVKRGVPWRLRLRYTLALGADLTGYTSELVIKDCEGAELFRQSVAVVPEVGTPHIGVASFEVNKTVTEVFEIGPKQNCHAVLRDGTTFEDIYFHGPVDAYVNSGGE